MAIQTGFVTLRGKTGDQIYYERDGKPMARAAATSTKQTDPTKQSSKDFGRANSATALIRKAFRPILKRYTDSKFDDRLKRKMIEIINTGPRELKGNLEIANGDVALLKTLEFNSYKSVGSLSNFLPKVEINNAETLVIRIPKMPMKNLFNCPPKAVVVQIEFMCTIFHFDMKNGAWTHLDDLEVPLNKESFPPGKYNIPLQAAENSVVAVAMAIGFRTPDDLGIGDRRFYAGKIIEAINIVDGKIVEFKYPEKIKKEQPVITESRIAFEPDEE